MQEGAPGQDSKRKNPKKKTKKKNKDKKAKEKTGAKDVKKRPAKAGIEGQARKKSKMSEEEWPHLPELKEILGHSPKASCTSFMHASKDVHIAQKIEVNKKGHFYVRIKADTPEACVSQQCSWKKMGLTPAWEAAKKAAGWPC